MREGLKVTSFDQVGFLLFQYNIRRGDIDEWLRERLEDSNWFAGKIYVSMNAVTHSPSPAEVMKVGVAMCNAPVDGVLMWRWPEAVRNAGMKEALTVVANACARNSGYRRP
jgi:hypothetical protein